MNLRNDIIKATSLSLPDNLVKFYPLHGFSQATKDRKMNERKLRKPQNLNILEMSDTDSNGNIDIKSNNVKPTFSIYEISAAIKEVNGGLDLSNKSWEERFLKNLADMSKEKETSENIKQDNVRMNQTDIKDNKYIKQKNKLHRNAAIMGLVKTNKITLQDLLNDSKENIAKKNKLETLHGINEFIADDICQVESVPLREDPEIFVHPLQIGINTKKFKDVDFTVSRIGKKKKITPAAYFFNLTYDETDFDFKKKETS